MPDTRSDIVDPLWQKVLNNRFTILEPIGRGGMGTVYRAIQSPLDRVVALKVLSSAPQLDPGFGKRFFLEASLTSKLRHPNTVTIIDYGETPDGIFYLAMEYLEGQPLSHALSESKLLPWPRCLNIGQQICRSLRGAHKLGVVHRDLKPSNVMLLKEDGEADLVKVLDFGLVKSFVQEGERKGEITNPGVFLGSPTYMAPEQLRGRADPRSDVYSLGVLLYHMLVGKPPFVARDAIDVMYQHVYSSPVPLCSVRPELKLSQRVEALVMKCLEKQTSRRFQSMDEVLDALRSAALEGRSSETAPAYSSDSGMWPIPRGTDVQPQPPIPTWSAETHSPDGAIEASSANTQPHPAPLLQPPPAPPTAADRGALPPAQPTEPTLAIDIEVAPTPSMRRRLAPLVHNFVRRPVVLTAVLLLVGSVAVPAIFVFRAGKEATASILKPSDPVSAPELKQRAAQEVRQSSGVTEASRSELAARESAKPGSETELQRSEVTRNEAPRAPQTQKNARVKAPLNTRAEVERALAEREADSQAAELGMLGPASSPQARGGGVLESPPPKPIPAAMPANPPLASAAVGSLPPPQQGRIQLDESKVQLRKISGPDPKYTPKALDAEVEGLMLVKCVVTAEGAVQACRVLKSLPFMDGAVISALEHRRYSPYLSNGKPIEVDYTFKIKLTLPQ